MGDFHCPLGAVTRGLEGCVNCGMCVAVSKEEMIAASAIIRKYMKSAAASRMRGLAIRKIAVCGKGGAGKSTFTSLLVRNLVEYGYRTLVVDTDSSNVGLHRKLGMERVPEPLLSALPRFGMGRVQQGETDWMKVDPLYASMIPDKFIEKSGRMALMVSGKIDDPFQGCACTMSELTKNLMFNLQAEDGLVTVIDAEAGVESFGRGMEQACDMVLILVEPSFESIDLAEKIQYLAEGLGVRRIRAIINKTVDSEQEEFVIEELRKREIRYLGCVPADSKLAMANMRGVVAEKSAAYDAVQQIAMLMLDEAEMPYRMPEL